MEPTALWTALRLGSAELTTASVLPTAPLAASALAAGCCSRRSGALARSLRCWATLRSAPGVVGAGPSAAAAPLLLRGGSTAVVGATACGSSAATVVTAGGRGGAYVGRLLPSLPARCGGLVLGNGGRLALHSHHNSRGPVQQQLRWLHVRRMATQGQAAAGTGAAAAAPVGRPASGLGRLLGGRLGDALRLHVAAAWQAYAPMAYATVAVLAVYMAWRIMYGVSNSFIHLNNTLAEYGIMGLAVTLVVLAALYLRWRVSVNPAAVYRQAMVQLNTNTGVLEVMGAPLAGSDVRAHVVTGGGVYLSKSFRLKLRSRRIQMMFPLSGSERKGLVSLEAKRKQGKYVWRLLAVDLGPELQQALPAGGAVSLSAAPPPRSAPSPAAAAATSRVFVVGDPAAYNRGGVLGELRAPFLQALSNSRSYEVEDELEDELDELALPAQKSGGGGKAAVQRVRAAVTSAAAMLSKATGPTAPPPAAAAAEADAAPVSTPPAAPKAVAAAAPMAVAKPSPPMATKLEAPAPASPPPPPTPSPPPPTSSWWSRMRTVMSGPGEAK